DRTRRQRHQHSLNLHIGQLVRRVFQNFLHRRARLLTAQSRVHFVQDRQCSDQVCHWRSTFVTDHPAAVVCSGPARPIVSKVRCLLLSLVLGRRFAVPCGQRRTVTIRDNPYENSRVSGKRHSCEIWGRRAPRRSSQHGGRGRGCGQKTVCCGCHRRRSQGSDPRRRARQG